MSVYPAMRRDCGDTWELVENWQADIPGKPTRRILIRHGFRTDGATIPMWAWSVIGHPFDGEFIRAALVHDALYVHHGLRRITADRIFRDILIQDGTPYWKASMMYGAVRAMGGAAWEDPARGDASHFISLSSA